MKYSGCLFHLLTPTPLVKHVTPTNKGKTAEIKIKKKTAFLPCTTQEYASNNTGETAAFSSHKQANKHNIIIHKHKNTQQQWGGERPCIPRPLGVYLKTRGSCESSQVGLLCMYVGAHKTLLTAVHHFDCPARLLRPKPPNTPNLLHPQHPPPSLARWLFFNCLWALAPLLYHH